MTDMKVVRITDEENDGAEKIIKLTTRSGVQFLINLQTAKVSKTIATMLESLDGVGCESFESGTSISSTPILIDCPHTDVLGKVLEWARHHRSDPPGDIPRSEDEYSVWDLMFFNVSDNVLLKMLVVSNYLEMRYLFRQTVTMLRHRLRSQSEEQLRCRAGAYGEAGELFSGPEQIQLKKEAALVKTSK